GLPQRFSSSTLVASGGECSGAPRPQFLYSLRTSGGIFGGSSGAPVLRATDGKVVGQLRGSCGPTATMGEGCDAANYVIDGALGGAMPLLAAWLAPVKPSPCAPAPA